METILSDKQNAKLEKLIAKRDRIKSILDRPDPLQQAFHGGRVGFKSGSAKRKHEQSVERELDLMVELGEIERKIGTIKNPMKSVKATEVSPSVWNVDDVAYEPLGNKVTIIKINTKTVTIRYSGGFQETIKPHLLNKK